MMVEFSLLNYLMWIMSKRSKDKFFKRTCGDFDMASTDIADVSIWYDTLPFLFFIIEPGCNIYELIIYPMGLEEWGNGYDIIDGVDNV
jgi:hypothetical protein